MNISTRKLGYLHTAILAAALSPFIVSTVYAEIGPSSAHERANDAYQLRKDRAKANHDKVLPAHPDNGDEALYGNRLNSYSKGLSHDALGIVNATGYNALINALTTGLNADFESIPLGVGAVKLRNPQAAYMFALEGHDPWSFTMPAAPTFSSAWQASDAIETLWQAITRDVHFSDYATNSLTQQAATDLSGFSDFRGPKSGGQVTTGVLFRGVGVGELNGPYISQFLFKPVPFGAHTITQRYNVPVAGNDHLFNYNEWLHIQNGGNPTGITSVTIDPISRYIRNNRDLSEYVLRDFSTQAYTNAALIINGFGSGVFSDTLPLVVSATQARGPLWSVNHVLDVLSRVAMSSQGVGWYQKWLVHRRARPEVFFGRVHNHKINAATYPIHSEVLNSSALPAVFSMYGTYLLPTANRAGSPTHPSYPAGHATLAGAAVTVLKAFFKGSFVIPSPVVASADGQSLNAYSGTLTIEGELNKLASNISIGRDAAGVHYRTDGDLGLILGEDLAISVLTDLVNTYHEQFPGFTFNKFDGTPVTISKQ